MIVVKAPPAHWVSVLVWPGEWGPGTGLWPGYTQPLCWPPLGKWKGGREQAGEVGAGSLAQFPKLSELKYVIQDCEIVFRSSSLPPSLLLISIDSTVCISAISWVVTVQDVYSGLAFYVTRNLDQRQDNTTDSKRWLHLALWGIKPKFVKF